MWNLVKSSAIAISIGMPVAAENALSAVLREANGMVIVVMSGDVDAQAFREAVDALADSSSQHIRFGLADNVVDRNARLAHLDRIAKAHPGWQVCRDWMVAGKEPTVAVGNGKIRDLAQFYGGSLIIMDNGSDDVDRYHPAIGDDAANGLRDNPIIAGFFDANVRAEVISDPDVYRSAWTTIYSAPLGMDMKGC